MLYTTRPLSDRTWLRSDRERKTSQFDATWTKTLTLLGKEIAHLGGRDIVIEVDVREQDIRLESLRAVDRYGATETGQQYAGFKALPAGRAMPASHMTTDAARELITSIIGPIDRPWDTRVRVAMRKAHPDRNDGDRTLWDQVEQAAQVLGVTR